MQPDFDRFFADYCAAFNRSLGDSVDADAITAAFTVCFVEASPAGVQCGQNGKSFRQMLEKGYDFYKKIGTKRMSVRRLDVTRIDALHHMVAVHWRAEYEKDGGNIPIDFQVTYMLQTLSETAPKIFAFVAGDEMGVLKAHGLIEG